MPALPTIEDVFRVTFNWLNAGTPAHNVMHFRAPSKTPQQVFTTISDNVTNAMWTTVDTGGIVVSLDILPLDGTSGTTGYPTGGGAKWTGNGGTDYTSQAPAALIKLSTGLRGPANRGRVFLPYTTEQAITAGIIDGDVVTQVTAGWVDFANDMLIAAVPLGVASYVGGGVWHQVDNLGLSNVLATVGRRQRQLRH